MGEFELINTYFSTLGTPSSLVKTGVGDDAAILDIPANQQLVTATDTLVAEVHFNAQWGPEIIAQRALASNLSDMAAMGARPFAVMLALTLPDNDEAWLDAFSATLDKQLDEADCQLIGGDTTKGPLTISLTLFGTVDKGQALTRHGALVDELICVTGHLGDCAYAYNHLNEFDERAPLFQKLLYPKAKIAEGLSLRGVATSCIDISDGLMQDVAHLASASRSGVLLFDEHMPLTEELVETVGEKQALELAYRSGDEYELCFTIKRKDLASIQKLFKHHHWPLTVIGHMTEDRNLLRMDKQKNISPFDSQGYQHF